jgi:hypothetical protein
MIIDCYISEGCTSETALRINVNDALQQENVSAEVKYHRINQDKAETLRLMGSPTVMVDGVDILPGEIPGIS